jgi:hypothetical protein
MPDDLAAVYLREVTERFRAYKKLGERAIAQVYDSGLTWQPDPDSNSIAVLVKHLAGNMRSRWTGFLSSDGEKPDRDRDAEFELTDKPSRATVLEWWEDGWGRLFDALGELRPEDLVRTVTVRGQAQSAVAAINTQMAHYAYHVGQIVLLARHLAGERWRALTIPKRR